jgi:propanol-preferring alcohol dehydrogenase
MRGLVMTKWRSEPELVDLPDPEPGPGEVLLKVGGSGCCRTDVHVYRDYDVGTVPWTPPFVLGHEVAGWAVATGPGVGGIDIGAGYLAYAALGCGLCPACRDGMENYCENRPGWPTALGLGRNGGMADYVVVPAAHLVPLGDFEPAAAAPLADAGLTPYHAVKRVRPDLVAGSYALVVGLGGLGTTAVQILRAITDAVIIGVDSRVEPLCVARAAGAHHVLRLGPHTVAEVRELTGGLGCDAVFDVVGSTETMGLGLAVGRRRATLTVIGITPETYPWGFAGVPLEMSISSTLWGSLPELREVVDLTQRGLVLPTIERYTLDGVMDAYKRLEHGELHARAVIVP